MGGVPDLEVLGSLAGTNEDPRGLRRAEAAGGEAGKPRRVCLLGAPWELWPPVPARRGVGGVWVVAGWPCLGWVAVD